MTNNASVTLDLEHLRQSYSTLLAQYNAAVYEYTTYLSQRTSNPCSAFAGDSTNVSQACYDHVWSASGCTTTGFVNATTDWAKSRTLNDLIYDSFLWATMTDPQHRTGCYGDSTKFATATEPDYKINKPNMVSIRGHAFNGTGIAGQTDVHTLQECEATCSTLSTCAGATFVSGGQCLLRSGDSPIVSASNESYAIVPKDKQLLLNMEDINKQLIATNAAIVSKIGELSPAYKQTVREGDHQSQELVDHYNSLSDERDRIAQLLRQYETLNSAENQTQINATQNYYSYTVLTIVAVVIAFILIKLSVSTSPSVYRAVQYGGDLGPNAYGILFFMILLIIGIHSFFKFFP